MNEYSEEALKKIAVKALSEVGFMPLANSHNIELVLNQKKEGIESNAVLTHLECLGVEGIRTVSGIAVSHFEVIKMLEAGVKPIAHEEIIEAFREAGVVIDLPAESHAAQVDRR